MALESTAATHDVSDVHAGSHLFHNAEGRDSQRAPIAAVDSTTTSSNGGGEAAVSRGGVLALDSHGGSSSSDIEAVQDVPATDAGVILLAQQQAERGCEACRKKALGNKSKKLKHTCQKEKRKSSCAATSERAKRARRSDMLTVVDQTDGTTLADTGTAGEPSTCADNGASCVAARTYALHARTETAACLLPAAVIHVAGADRPDVSDVHVYSNGSSILAPFGRAGVDTSKRFW